MFKVHEMMTPNPVTLFAHQTIEDAKSLMDLKRIRHIPIISNTGHLEGLVTQRDILFAQNSSLEKEIGDVHYPMKEPLSRLPDRSLLTVSPGANLKTAALYMQEHKIGCLLVVEKKKLVGIITDADFIAIAINLLEIQEETEPMEEDEIQ